MAASAGAVYVDVKANTNPFERSMSGLTGLGSKFGGLISKALAGATIAKFGQECTEVASRLTEVQNVVDQVFPHMSSQIDAWSQGLVDAFGLSETKAKEYVGTLGSMARSLGFTEEQAYGMSTQLAELSGDIASFYDMSSDQAYEKLQSIFTGMVQPLRSIGVNMTQASLDAFALANGFGRTTDEMSEAERALLRFQFVLDRTSFAQGDFARTNMTWANQLRILSMRFEELKVAIGNSLIVVLTPVIQVINTVIAALTTAANAVYRFISALASTGIARFAKAAGKAVGLLSGNSSEAAESTSDLADAQDAAAGAAGGQAAAVGKLNRMLAGFDRINKLAAQSASGGGGGGAGGGISDTFSALTDAETAAGGLQDALDDIVLPEKLIDSFNRLRVAASNLSETVGTGLSWAWENVLKPLGEWTIGEAVPRTLDVISGALEYIDTYLKKIAPVAQALWESVIAPMGAFLGDVLLGALDGVVELLGKARDWVDGLDLEPLKSAVEGLKDPLDHLLTPLKGLFDMMGDASMWAWDEIFGPLGEWLVEKALPVAVEALGAAFDALGSALDFVKTLLDPLSSAFSWLWEHALEPMAESIGEDLLGKLEDLKVVLEGIGDFLEMSKEGWGIAIQGFKDFADCFSEAIDGTKERFESFKDFLSGVAEGMAMIFEGITTGNWQEVQDGLDRIRESWDGLNSKTVTLDALDKASPTVEAATDKVAGFESKTVTLGATDSASTKIKAATDKMAGFKSKTVTLGATDKASAKIKAATDKLAGFKSKTVTLGATDKASAKIAALNKKSLNNHWADLTVRKNDVNAQLDRANRTALKDHWADLNFTPVLTKNSLYMKGSGSSMSVYFAAQGGFFERNTPRFAVIGDNTREGEIVSPESKFQTMLDKATQQGGGNAETVRMLGLILQAVQGIDPNVYLDGKDITRNVVGNINRQVQSTGRSPLLV